MEDAGPKLVKVDFDAVKDLRASSSAAASTLQLGLTRGPPVHEGGAQRGDHARRDILPAPQLHAVLAEGVSREFFLGRAQLQQRAGTIAAATAPSRAPASRCR